MAIFAIKFVFWALSTFANLASLLIFRGIAYVLVLAIQGLRAPGLAINTILERAAGGLKAGFEYLLERLSDAIVSLITSGFDLLTEAISGSLSSTGFAIGELVAKTKNSFDDLAKALPEVFEGASEMIGAIVGDLWNNYKDAIAYVLDKL